MRMNKMTSYAIRIVTRLAEEDRKLTSKELMELEHIPHGVLMKILRMLREEGILEAHQGRGGLTGGFSLKGSKKNISVYQLVMAMEGEVNMHPAIEEECYEHGKKELYKRLEELNSRCVLALKEVRIMDFV